jgi:hypothetical protein
MKPTAQNEVTFQQSAGIPEDLQNLLFGHQARLETGYPADKTDPKIDEARTESAGKRLRRRKVPIPK